MPSPNTRTCPACGTVMPASFPEGLCPKCLLKAAAGQESGRTLPVAAPVSGARPARPGGVPSVETLRGLFPELEILDVLGAGGMGAVYKARQPRLNRLVALKIMVAPPGHEADFALRFEREAQVLARLNHPHIVILYDFGELGAERTGADPLFYFLMEHVDGTDLGQLIKSGELKPAQALAIVPQICEALQYAHDQGITHRDIKPPNILLDKKGTVKIADFGLAKVVGGSAEDAMMTGLTQTGTAMGTPHYMAPEQWEHPDQVDHRADIYALGVVFYEMLTGERPAGVFEPPSKKTKPPVDRKLDKVVLRAMEKNPERRYQQAGQIGQEVTRISGEHKRRPAATGAEKPKRGPLKPLLAAGVASVLTVAGWFLWQGGATDTPAPAPPQAVWVPMYRQEAELAELLKSPTRLYPELKANPDLARDPASGLKLAGGWLTPASTPVKLPLPSARYAGVRLRIRMSEPKRMDGASIWLRNLDGGIVYTGAWRGIMRHFGKAQKPAEYLVERKNLVPKKPGDSFTLEFYAIGTHLVCRYEGDVLRVSEPGENRAPGTLNHLMILNPVTDIEFINLDGLSEAEALKLAGVEGDQVSRQWERAFPDPTKLPGLVESKDGWVLSDHLTVPVRTASGGEMRLLNAGLRARMRFSEGAGPEAAQLILRRGSRGGDHFELRYYRNLSGDRQNALQIRHWDHRSKQSTRLAGIGVDEDVHDAPGGFVLEFYAIGSRLHGRLNGAYPVTTDVPDAAFVNPGEAGFAKLKDCWLTDMEILHLDGLPEAEALKLAGVVKPGRLHGTGTLRSGKALDLTRCGAFDDFVDVAGGPDSWVALRASGQTLSSDGQADFTGIRKIARSYGGYHCFIDDAGGLRFHPAREMTLPDSLKGRVIVDAACGSHHGVALLEDGQAVVFGKRYEEAMEDTTQAQGTGTPRWPQPDPAALRDVKGVAVTQTHAATLHHDGTVSVWGWQGPVTWQPEPELKPVRQLSSFHDALHLLDEAGQVWTFSLPRSVHPDQPVSFNGRVRRQAGQVARLRDHLWLRQDGAWSGIEADRPTMEMLGSASLRPETNFTLLASIAGAKPYGYALWIEPVEAE